MKKKTRTPLEEAVDRELIEKGKDVIKEFDQSRAIHVPPKQRDNKLISIRLPMDMLKRLRNLAAKKGDIGYQQLIKIYLSDGLKREEKVSTLEIAQSKLSKQHEVSAPISTENLYMWYSSGVPSQVELRGYRYQSRWLYQTLYGWVQPNNWLAESYNQEAESIHRDVTLSTKKGR